MEVTQGLLRVGVKCDRAWCDHRQAAPVTAHVLNYLGAIVRAVSN